jgi:hypothetical protein
MNYISVMIPMGFGYTEPTVVLEKWLTQLQYDE